MNRALPLAALLGPLLALAACAPAAQAPAQAPTGVTSQRGGGAQQLGNQGVGNPIATTTTAPAR